MAYIIGIDTSFITHLIEVPIGNVSNFIGVPITPAVPSYFIVGGSFNTFKKPTTNYIVATDSTGSLDTTFNMGVGFNNIVRCMATQSDGKIIVGGTFTSYSGSAGSYLVRLNTNGTKDTTFTTPLNGEPYAIAIQSDGKIIIGGFFTTINSFSSPRLARLNSNGTRDSTFNVGAGFNSTVTDLRIQSDGKIIVVGQFSSYSGSATFNTRIIRLNTNGTKDTTYNVGSSGFNSTPNGCDIQSDNKIIVGGAFTSYSGSTLANRLVRINTDGTRDATFNVGASFGGFSPALVKIQPNQKILVGGFFPAYSGSINNGIVRINSDGTKDTTFNMGSGFFSYLFTGLNNAVSLDQNGGIYVCASFLSYSGSSMSNIVKLTPSGSIDTTFDVGYGLNTLGGVALISSSRAYFAGSFQTYKDQYYNRVVMIDGDGTVSSSFNPGAGFTGGIVNCAVTQSDGKIIVGGLFTSYSGSTTTRIARINTNGTLDTTFNVGAGFGNNVLDLRIQSDGKIIAVGAFTSYSGSTTTRIVRINTNGTLDTTFNVGTGFNSTGNKIKILSTGQILVGGLFTTYSGSSTPSLIILNTDGTKDITFNQGTGLTSYVYDMIEQPDGKLVIAGNFPTYNGSSSNRLVRINTDGTRDATLNVGTTGFNSAPTVMAQQPDGKILLAGAFTTYSGSSSNRIIRLNTNGTKDTTFTIGTGFDSFSAFPAAMYLTSNNKIYCGSTFTTYSGSRANNIIKLNTNGTIDTTFNQGTASFNNSGIGFDLSVQTMISI
jgi:uncharacterized delta-60 repeat protein